MPDPKPQGSTPKDPVCGMEGNPESPFRTTYGGREYLFCSQPCLTKFTEDPAQSIESVPTKLPRLRLRIRLSLRQEAFTPAPCTRRFVNPSPVRRMI